MQKISSYLYPNRIQLLADLANFNVEYTNVYQRTIKIYKGVDNVLEFDIKNADQKKLDLLTTPLISNLQLNIMDAGGKALPNSPYTVTASASLKGIATATIPSADLDQFSEQYFTYSVTADDTNSNNILLYADSKFGGTGQIQLVGSATPTTRKNIVYDKFSGEINFMGNVINHSSSIPCKFYEAVPTDTLTISVNMTNFIGTIYVEGTEDSTISVESYKNATKIQSFTTAVAHTETGHTFNIPIQSYNYVRVSWVYPDVWQHGSQSTSPYGTVDQITIIS